MLLELSATNKQHPCIWQLWKVENDTLLSIVNFMMNFCLCHCPCSSQLLWLLLGLEQNSLFQPLFLQLVALVLKDLNSVQMILS